MQCICMERKKAKLLVISHLIQESEIFASLKMTFERRNTLIFKFKEDKIQSLNMLSSKLTPIKLIDFKKKHGKVLDIWTKKVDLFSVVTLAQSMTRLCASLLSQTSNWLPHWKNSRETRVEIWRTTIHLPRLMRMLLKRK